MNNAGKTILRLRHQNKILKDCMVRVGNSIMLVSGAGVLPIGLRKAFEAVAQELEKGIIDANKL